MKRKILIILVMVISLSLLFGCSSNQEIVESQIIKANKGNNGAQIECITLKGNLIMSKGETQDLEVEIYPNEFDDAELLWFSSNSKVIKVNNGRVEAISEGTARISAETIDGDVIGEIDIAVNDDYVSTTELVMTMDGRIVKSGSLIELGVDKSAKLGFTYIPVNATQGVKILVLNSDCVIVSDDYTITGVKAGKATLMITSLYGDAFLQYEVKVR